MSTLGEKLSSIRKSKGYSQERLAEEANINLRTLQRVEKGKTKPHGETLTRICNALDISVEEVVNKKQNKAPYYLKLIALSLLILSLIVFLYSEYYPFLDTGKVLITKRIQYDVPIVGQEPEYYWWIENLDVSDRISFINILFDKALSGEVKTCDIYLNPVGPEELINLLTESHLLTFQNGYPPHNSLDTIITQLIEPAEIDVLRFQEEWSYNDEDLIMEKRVLGICLVKRVEVQGGLADRPLFWIYFDDALLNEETTHPNF